jgi:phosphoribosyl 1,2-cyclic phosphodiesterase
MTSKPDTDSLNVIFRGVRGSTPAPGGETARYGGNTACVEIRAGDEILILDAGTGIRRLGLDLRKEFGTKPIEASLLISHTHWDHIQGLPFFVPAYSAENKIRVFAAKGGRETLKRALSNQMDPIHFPVGVGRLAALTAVEELTSNDVVRGKFRVRVAALNHPGGCAAFRIEVSGASLAYLPDHEPSETVDAELAKFVHDVDLLILDTQYTEAEYSQRHGWGHGCLSDSVALAMKAGVRELAFFHHDPSHNDDQIDRMVERGRELALSSTLTVGAARERQMITLQRAPSPLSPSPLANTAPLAAL